MKKFFKEFKTFITRGNVLDMAVGVIIGGAFTAIVTALTSNILQPIINWVIYLLAGGNGGSLEGVYTFLVGNASDLANAIYIDWGMFVSAIINFLLIALVLFMIIKTINRINEQNEKFANGLKGAFPSKEDRKEMKAQGLNYRDLEQVKQFKAQKEADAKAKEEADKLAKEQADKDAKAHSTEGLLESILELLQKQGK